MSPQTSEPWWDAAAQRLRSALLMVPSRSDPFDLGPNPQQALKELAEKAATPDAAEWLRHCAELDGRTFAAIHMEMKTIIAREIEAGRAPGRIDG